MKFVAFYGCFSTHHHRIEYNGIKNDMVMFVDSPLASLCGILFAYENILAEPLIWASVNSGVTIDSARPSNSAKLHLIDANGIGTLGWRYQIAYL